MRPTLVSALVIALATMVGQGCGGDGEAALPIPRSGEELLPDVTACPDGPTVKGIDVSSYQGSSINWPLVASSGVKFAFAKASEGLTVTDPDFPGNWSRMKGNVVRGAYHFFHPQDDGAQQADVFLAVVGTLGEQGDLPPVLDWEVTDSKTSAVNIAQAQKFVDEIKARTGLTTIIYTYPSFWTGLGSPAQFADEPLWVANYTGSISSCPVLLSPWSRWAIWQWSSNGTGPGVSGEDLNLFNGSLDELNGFATPPLAQLSGNEALTLVNWPDGHLELFGRSPSGAMLHSATTAGGDSWSAGASLGSGVECGSAAASWGGPRGYPELFSPLASGDSGDLFNSAGSWNSYQSFGGQGLAHLSTLVGMDGLVRVFALGSDGAIWVNSWSLSLKAFRGWSSLGGQFVTGAGTVTWGDGALELFATDSAGGLWASWTDELAGTPWSPWTKLGDGVASRPVPVRSGSDVLLFARGLDGSLVQAQGTSVSSWSALRALSASGAIIGEPAAIVNVPGSALFGAELFTRDSAGHVLHLAQSQSGFGALAPLGAQVAASDPFAWVRSDGAVELFAVDRQGSLTRSLRGADGGYGAWSAIGSGFDPCAPALVLVDGGSPGDGGNSDGGNADSGTNGDAGSPADAGAHDGGAGDAGSPDAGHTDAGGHGDAGHADAGHDGGAADGGLIHAVSGGCSSEGPGTSGLLWLALVALCGAVRLRTRAGAAAR